MDSFIRLLKSGWTNYFRNFWLSTTATLVMLITLLILTSTFLLYSLSATAMKTVQDRVDVSVYMKNSAAEAQILSIKDKIQQMPEVASVTYVSRDQALADFKAKHADEPLILESVNVLSSNPLSAVLHVKAKDLNQYQDLSKQISDNPNFQPYITKVNYQDYRDEIDRLAKIISAVRKGGFILIIVFALIAVLVTFNTIRLTIYNRREEVEIMRLVGATNWYIRLPFIIESMLYAIAASVVTFLLMIPVFHYVMPKATKFFGLNPGQSITPVGILSLFALQLLAALLLGVLSSLIAIRRHLRV